MEALFRVQFERHWTIKLSTRRTPASGNLLVIGQALFSLLALGMGSVPLFFPMNGTPFERAGKILIFLLIGFSGIWLARFPWLAAQDAKRKGISLGEAMEQILEAKDQARIDKSLRSSRRKMASLLGIILTGLFVFFGISAETKAAFAWNHPALAKIFYLNGLITATAIQAVLSALVFSVPSGEPALAQRAD